MPLVGNRGNRHKGSDMSHILMVTQFFPNPDGKGNTGGTISNLNMLRVLGRRYAVTVLSFDPATKVKDFAEEPFQVVSQPAPPWRAPGLVRHWLGFVRARTQALIDKTGPPTSLFASTSTLAAFDVCPPNTARVAVVQAYENFGVRCPWVPSRQRMNLGKLAVIRRFQDRRLMRCADLIVTNSQFMRQAIYDRFEVPEDKIHALIQDCATDPSSTLAPKAIGFVNRGPEKGLAFVLDLARRSPDLQYRIYGQDRGRPDVLADNVDWRGWQSDRNEMFSSARLWLVPSLWAEPFGRVSIEAQAANSAVLVAGTGGLPETVADARFRMTGFNPDQWLARMRGLLEIGFNELQQNGSQIRSMFSSKVHDDRILEVMDLIMKGRKEHRDV